jgi:hypothetical protein
MDRHSATHRRHSFNRIMRQKLVKCFRFLKIAVLCKSGEVHANVIEVVSLLHGVGCLVSHLKGLGQLLRGLNLSRWRCEWSGWGWGWGWG